MREAKGQLLIVGASLPAILAPCLLSFWASWLPKGQNLLTLFYRWGNWSSPWIGGMPQDTQLVRAQPREEFRALMLTVELLPLKHAGWGGRKERRAWL